MYPAAYHAKIFRLRLAAERGVDPKTIPINAEEVATLIQQREDEKKALEANA